MLGLSTNSIKKLMECMEAEENTTELFNLRRGCFRLNQVAVQNNFHKRKLSSFTLYLKQATTRQPDTILNAHFGRDFLEIFKERQQNRNPEPYNINQELDTISEIYNRKLQKYEVGQSVKNINQLVEKALTEGLEKVRSVNKLRLIGLKLDGQFLEIIKKFSSTLRFSSTIYIGACAVEWTQDELLTFLKLFENLKVVVIKGTFAENFLTDKHLSLVSEEITVMNYAYNVFDFPAITPKSCEKWLNNGIKKVVFSNITTNLSYSDINDLAHELKLDKKDDISESKEIVPTKLKFGELKCSDEDFREVILAQRKRKTEWTIKKSMITNDAFKVSSKSGGYSYSFNVDRPYHTPNFANASVRQVRVESREAGITPENLQRLRAKLDTVYEILKDYRDRKILPTPPARNLQIGVRMRMGVIELANFCEEVILFRIQQLEEMKDTN